MPIFVPSLFSQLLNYNKNYNMFRNKEIWEPEFSSDPDGIVGTAKHAVTRAGTGFICGHKTRK